MKEYFKLNDGPSLYFLFNKTMATMIERHTHSRFKKTSRQFILKIHKIQNTLVQYFQEILVGLMNFKHSSELLGFNTKI
jgi:hypothetical protein